MILTTDKITVTIPHELKIQLLAVKEELKISMSAIYKEALEAYLQKKEIERWERGAILASQDKEYMTLCKEMGNEGVEIYDY